MLKIASVNNNKAWSTCKLFSIRPLTTYTMRVFPIKADRLSYNNFNKNFIIFPFIYPIFECIMAAPNNMKNKIGVNLLTSCLYASILYESK